LKQNNNGINIDLFSVRYEHDRITSRCHWHWLLGPTSHQSRLAQTT